MLRMALYIITASLFLTACEPASRCDRQITRASQAVDSARAAKSGLAKLNGDLLQASAKIASAEAKRIGKDYEGCIAEALAAADLANKAANP